jgi:hypothetical protein
MRTESSIDLFIAFLVIVVVAPQVPIVQIKKRRRDMPGGILKS